MGCMDSRHFGIESINNWDPLAKFGFLDDDYPGCGACSDCLYSVDYDREKVTSLAAEANLWHKENPNRYTCRWELGNHYGEFDFFAGSLEKAREIAMRSLFQWDTMLVALYK